MTHDSLLFPHPIIRQDGTDYPNCSFKMLVEESNIREKIIHIKLILELSSKSIEKLIINNNAKYYIIIKCTKTYNRHVIHSKKPEIKLELPLYDYADKLVISSYVVATNQIDSFRSEEHHPEIQNYLPKGWDLTKGSILAVGPSRVVIIDSLKNIHSAIKIVTEDRMNENEYIIDTDEDYVNIKMNSSTAREISEIRNLANDVLYPSLYFAAIEHAIVNMQDNQNSKWAQALKKTLEKHKIKVDENLQKRSNEYAQKIMGLPLANLIKWNKERSAQ
ncbi:MAG: hypothetical protein MPJ22_00830 [Pirellulales bacterium]|nr:hypothetical protein [Pirellulales bacterium]